MDKLEDLWTRINIDTGEVLTDPPQFDVAGESQTRTLTFPPSWGKDGHIDIDSIKDGTRLIARRSGNSVTLVEE